MKRLLRKLIRNRRGSAAIEFAIAVPILVSFVWGIFQIGMVFEAKAGMEHALGEGARAAVIYDTTTTDHRVTDTVISSKITATKFGTGNGTWGTPTIDRSTVNSGYITISVTYSQPLNFLFFSLPSASLSASKRVYLPA